MKYIATYEIKHQRDGDAGFDLRAQGDYTVYPGNPCKMPLGIFVEIPPGSVGLIMPRSGLMVNHGVGSALGVIDSNYRGELSAVMINHTDTSYKIKDGERVCQLVVLPLTSVVPVMSETVQLTKTNRGTEGFGSSGMM